MELFREMYDQARKKGAPLAERLRPESIDDFFGQDHILGEGKFLYSALKGKTLPSLILWGPPGSGKTTLAKILAHEMKATFLKYSAVLSGIKEIREAIREVDGVRVHTGRPAILFIDEIHRFNKAQQDALLPYAEDGTITLIGTTTENPSFEVRSALLSRCKVLILYRLDDIALEKILTRAIHHPTEGVEKDGFSISDSAKKHIISSADGDGRAVLNALEATTFIAATRKTKKIGLEIAKEALRKKALLYDKSGEEHYNLISAFHKSLRGSDPDASLYWFARMLKGGEDPLYVARRMIRFASEDVGNADPRALSITIDAHRTYRVLGSPEGELALAQAVLYLACAPKSNRVYSAFNRAKRDVEDTGALPVPLHLRNAPTELMEKLDYGKDYRYPHDFEDGFIMENYFPETLGRRNYYDPTDRGLEKEIKEKLDRLWGTRPRKGRKKPDES